MIDPALVGLVSAATALVASIAGPLTTLYMGRLQILASVLSANRQKWIDNFRDSIAAFCSQVAAIVHQREKVVSEGHIHLAAEPEVLRRFEAMILTLTRIRLLTDPMDEKQRHMLEVMQGLLKMMQNAPPDADIVPEVEARASQIVDLSVVILRGEWTKVKSLD